LYRQGEISTREIARHEGVQGWKRDVATPVRSQVRARAGEFPVSSVPSQTSAVLISGTHLTAAHGFLSPQDESGLSPEEESEAPEWWRHSSSGPATACPRRKASRVIRFSRDYGPTAFMINLPFLRSPSALCLWPPQRPLSHETGHMRQRVLQNRLSEFGISIG